MEYIQWKGNSGKPGVYAIVHLDSGRKYIGSSMRTIGIRWTSHKIELKRGKHRNKNLQEAFNQFGIEAFVIRILELCPAEQCYEREQFYLSNHVEWGFDFNICQLSQTTTGFRHSKDFKEEFSNRRKGAGNPFSGRKHSAETKRKMSEKRKEWHCNTHSIRII